MTTFTKTEPLYLHQQFSSGEYMIFQTDMTEYGYVLVNTQGIEITMDIPEGYDKVNSRIDQLKDEKQKIQAEAHLKAENIEEQIQSLLCIEDQSIGNKD